MDNRHIHGDARSTGVMQHLLVVAEEGSEVGAVLRRLDWVKVQKAIV